MMRGGASSNRAAAWRSARTWCYVDLADGAVADAAWWIDQWRKFSVQGVVLPAGDGAEGLRRLTTLAQAARSAGLAVLAGVKVKPLTREAITANPAWAARSDKGEPIAVNTGYAACVNGGLFDAPLSDSISRAVTQAPVDGVLGVGWSGLGWDTVCYCPACQSAFRAAAGADLPGAKDRDAPVFDQWVAWNRARRTDMWRANDRAASRAGGAGARWIGLIPTVRTAQIARFQDVAALAAEAPMLFVDNADAARVGRFGELVDDGLYLTGLAGGKPIVLLTPTYHRGVRTFAAASAAPGEARLAILAGLTGGLAPAVELPANLTSDVRTLSVAAPVMTWVAQNGERLGGRAVPARIAVVWSPTSAALYGRDQVQRLSEAPFRGMAKALRDANIPHEVWDESRLGAGLRGVDVLILPEVAVMSDAQAAAVREFVRGGGVLIATGVTSLYDAMGRARRDYALQDVFGVNIQGALPARSASAAKHDYVRLQPEYAARTPGPHKAGERTEPGARHPILKGFDATDLLAFGGILSPQTVAADRTVLMTYVPPFPSAPIDEVYPRAERTAVPGLVVGTFGRGRVAYMPADFDRRYGIDPIADHRALLANLLAWATGPAAQLRILGPSKFATRLEQHGDGLVLHLVNLTGADNQAGAVRETTPVGPLQVSVPLPPGGRAASATLLVAGRRLPVRVEGGRAVFELDQVAEHEMVVLA
jgi:hypothetical protein